MTLDDVILNLNEDLTKERTHMAFYVYHASFLSGPHALEYRELFEQSAASEMKHVLAFQDRILGLGGDVDIGGDLFPITPDVLRALELAIALEEKVVLVYTKRIEELDGLTAHPTIRAYLKVFYEAQLQDSYEDCERFRRLRLRASRTA